MMAGDDPETEARLGAAARGDGQALGWLLEQYRDRLRRMIVNRLDDRLLPRLDPSDVIQETLADAARKLPDYLRDRPLPFYAWLHRLASERLTQMHRHHLGALRREAGRERPGAIPRAESSALRLADVLAASGTSPSEQLLREEQRLAIRLALDELPEPDRELLTMRYMDHLSFAEIAAVLAITESAARVRHFRAIQRIGPLLDSVGEESGP